MPVAMRIGSMNMVVALCGEIANLITHLEGVLEQRAQVKPIDGQIPNDWKTK